MSDYKIKMELELHAKEKLSALELDSLKKVLTMFFTQVANEQGNFVVTEIEISPILPRELPEDIALARGCARNFGAA